MGVSGEGEKKEAKEGQRGGEVIPTKTAQAEMTAKRLLEQFRCELGRA